MEGGARSRALANRTSSRIPQACHRWPQTLRGGVDVWVLSSPHLPPPAPRPPHHRGSSANLCLKSHPSLSGKPHHYELASVLVAQCRVPHRSCISEHLWGRGKRHSSTLPVPFKVQCH